MACQEKEWWKEQEILHVFQQIWLVNIYIYVSECCCYCTVLLWSHDQVNVTRVTSVRSFTTQTELLSAESKLVGQWSVCVCVCVCVCVLPHMKMMGTSIVLNFIVSARVVHWSVCVSYHPIGVTICRYLKGLCEKTDGSCLLSHKISKEKVMK